MNKLQCKPEQSTYAVYDGADIAAVNYGIQGAYRRSFFNNARLVDVSWPNASRRSYAILAQSHRAFVKSGGAPFLVDLFIDETELEEFECVFVRGSFALTEVRGLTYSVKAQLWVRPKKYDVANKPWVTDGGLNRYVAAMATGVFSVSGKNITFFLSSRRMAIEPASYILAANNVGFAVVTNIMNADPASFSVSGKATISTLKANRATFSVSGREMITDDFLLLDGGDRLLIDSDGSRLILG